MQVEGVVRDDLGNVMGVTVGFFDQRKRVWSYVDLYSENAIREIVRQEIAHHEEQKERDDV